MASEGGLCKAPRVAGTSVLGHDLAAMTNHPAIALANDLYLLVDQPKRTG